MSLRDYDVEQMQGEIYPEGKVYFLNGNWTSSLWQDLSKQGWKSSTSPAGYVTLYSAEGNAAVNEFGMVQALIKLARIMR